MNKRIISLFLALVMVAGVLPGFTLCVSAEDAPEAAWGTDAGSLTNTGTLAEAIDALNAEDSTVGYIRLLSDVDLPYDSDFYIESSATALTIDFNGHTVYGCMDWLSYPLFEIERDVTLQDTSDNPGGISVLVGSPFAALKSLTVTGGVYKGSGCCFAEGYSSDSTEITGGTFRSSGATAFVVRGCDTLTISGGTFISDGDYAVSCDEVGKVTISGGTFSHGSSGALDIVDEYFDGIIEGEDYFANSPTQFTLSGSVTIIDATPGDGSADIHFECGSPDSRADLSAWTGRALSLYSGREVDGGFLGIPAGWWIHDSMGAAQDILPTEELCTIKPGIPIRYDNSVSGWKHVAAAFTFSGRKYNYLLPPDGDSGLFTFPIPDGVHTVYFTNYSPGMPESEYPEGYQRTVDFTVEAGNTYTYVPGDTGGSAPSPEEQPELDYGMLYWMLMVLYNQQFDINAAATDGGTITSAGVSKVKYGKNITYTVIPAEGYMIADVLVDGESVGAVSEYTFKQVKKDHSITAVFAEIPWQNPYSDVSESDWFYEDVEFVTENNLMIGTVENETFAPDLTATRAMIVTILWRLEGEPILDYLMQFEDVPQDEWYSEAVRWAAANGIVLGYDDGLFRPEKAITREQLAAILHRYAAYKGMDNGVIFPMIPQYDYSLWAENDVIWADMNGLFDGIGNDMTDMTSDASRAEVAAMLGRLMGK